MERSKSHNFWISLNSGKAKPTELIEPYIFYSYGSKNQRKKKTAIQLPFGVWDKKNKSIKKSSIDKYLTEANYLNQKILKNLYGEPFQMRLIRLRILNQKSMGSLLI